MSNPCETQLGNGATDTQSCSCIGAAPCLANEEAIAPMAELALPHPTTQSPHASDKETEQHTSVIGTGTLFEREFESASLLDR
jgi:hypothetical protein